MRTPALSLLLLALGSLTPAALAQPPAAITVTHQQARTTTPGPADHFTGAVRMETVFSAQQDSRTVCSLVSFEPGARTAWHTHPLGQSLIVTQGEGWVQQAGGPVQIIRPGDVVWIPAGVKHWHGATPTSAMTHYALMERLDGNHVNWMEQVTDEQYLPHH